MGDMISKAYLIVILIIWKKRSLTSDSEAIWPL